MSTKPEGAVKYTRPQQKPLVRFGKKIRHPLNRFFARQSLVGTDPLIDPAMLAGLDRLAPDWQAFQAEAAALLESEPAIPPLGEVSPDHRRIARDEKWKSFFLSGYGYDSADNRAKCPRISAAIDNVPGVVMAFLSILEPHTHVPSHRGLTKAWLNCHLPLIVPTGEERCEIEIDGKLYRWTPGEWLVFDETFTHEVWNLSDQPRLVLFLQVKRPMRWPGRLLSRIIFSAIRRSSFVQDVRQKLAPRS